MTHRRRGASRWKAVWLALAWSRTIKKQQKKTSRQSFGFLFEGKGLAGLHDGSSLNFPSDNSVSGIFRRISERNFRVPNISVESSIAESYKRSMQAYNEEDDNLDSDEEINFDHINETKEEEDDDSNAASPLDGGCDLSDSGDFLGDTGIDYMEADFFETMRDIDEDESGEYEQLKIELQAVLTVEEDDEEGTRLDRDSDDCNEKAEVDLVAITATDDDGGLQKLVDSLDGQADVARKSALDRSQICAKANMSEGTCSMALVHMEKGCDSEKENGHGGFCGVVHSEEME